MEKQKRAQPEKSLLYRCPQCDEVLRISADMVGQSIACPNCSQPVIFEVEHAIPVKHQQPGDHVSVIPDEPATIDGRGYERELDVRHPVMFRAHPLQWLAGAVVAGGGVGYSIYLYDAGRTTWGHVSLAVGLVGLGYLAHWWLVTRYTRLRITNLRTIYRRGIVSRNSTEVRHDDVRNIQVHQSAPERIVGVGNIAISSAGQDGLEIVAKDIPHPEEIVDLIRAHQTPA